MYRSYLLRLSGFVCLFFTSKSVFERNLEELRKALEVFEGSLLELQRAI